MSFTLESILTCQNYNLGTYLYTEKSARDHTFQKRTFTDQKKRNLVRPLVFVTTSGHILHVAHPYLARNNDAIAFRHFLTTSEGKAFRELMGDQGVILADRGFRDVSDFLTSLGLVSIMPAFIPKTSKTLSELEANRTRKVTKVRSAVERAIGRLKQFRLFRGTIPISCLANVSKDFQITAAILNMFRPPLTKDNPREAQWAGQMLSRIGVHNDLKKRYESANSIGKHTKATSKKITEIGDVNFPRLKEDDIRNLCFGSYQLDEGKNYIQDQLGRNESYVFLAHLDEPDLLQVSIQSRHRGDKAWKVFVKFAPESQVYFTNQYNVQVNIEPIQVPPSSSTQPRVSISTQVSIPRRAVSTSTTVSVPRIASSPSMTTLDNSDSPEEVLGQSSDTLSDTQNSLTESTLSLNREDSGK